MAISISCYNRRSFIYFPDFKIIKILSIILILLASIKTGNSQREFSNFQQIPKGMHILIEKIMEKFDGCENVYVKQTMDNNNMDYSTEVVRNLNLEAITKASAGAHQVSLGFNITYPRHKDIHRFAKKHCSVGLLTLNEFNNFAGTWLVETVIPRYGPILRKDLDHFIIISPNEAVSDLILRSPNFGNKIKYKLVLTPQSNSKIICKTVNLYGNAGLPKLAVLQIFDYNSSNGLNSLENLNFFPDFTKYFNGKVFRFAIPKVAFRFEIEMRDDKRYHPKRGFYKWWLDEAMLKFNFTYDIFWASFGGGTGKRLKNGTWVGATGDLYYGKADCSFIVGEIYSRHKFLGWSSSISYEWVIFVTHIPKKSYSPKAIFWPFSSLMWGLFLVTMCVMTFSLRAMKKVVAVDPNRFKKDFRWDYISMFEYLFATLMEQDKQGPFYSHSIRVLCAFWLLFAIVTATAYKGKLVSLIAFPVNTWVPTTFEQLANSDFKVALNVVGKAGAAYVLIASSTNPVFQTLTSRMELIPESEVCLERAMKEDLGCIIWKGISDYAAVKNLTDKNGRVPLQDSTQIALFIGDGLVYERRAIFGEHLDRTIQAVVQMGLTIKWFQLDEEFIKKERKIYEESRNISKPIYDYDDDGPKKLIVSQFTGLFLLTLGGFFISGGQFVVELYKYKRSIAKGVNETLKREENSVFNKGTSSSSLSLYAGSDKWKAVKQVAGVGNVGIGDEMELSHSFSKFYYSYTDAYYK